MKYCSDCGAQLTMRIPAGDTLPRHVCSRCGAVHYRNPKIVAGCIPEAGSRILLCRRAIAPRAGRWTLPAGFLERGETTAEGAARETLEEANARVRIEQLYALFDIPHIDQVYLMFRARLLEEVFSPGAESLEVALFEERAVPWGEIAFPVVRETLTRYFADRREGRFPVHHSMISERLDPD